MLSDTSIVRDKDYPYLLRFWLKMRKVLSKKKRVALNAKLNKELGDIDFSVFSNNCLGGIFYHDCGKRFTSPTINTALDGEDFIKFLENPKHYFETPFEFITFPGHNYPIAKIDDIEVRFVHYKTEEECIEKWRERAKRINWDNLYIIATNHDGMCQDKWMERFDKLPYKNKIMYVSKDYPQYPWAVKVPQFDGRWQVRIMTNFANFKGERYYESCFDLADWIKKTQK